MNGSGCTIKVASWAFMPKVGHPVSLENAVSIWKTEGWTVVRPVSLYYSYAYYFRIIMALHTEELLIFLTVKFNVDSKYWLPLRKVNRQCPFWKRQKKTRRTHLSLWTIFSTDNNARKFCRTRSVLVSFSRAPWFHKNWLSSKAWCWCQIYSSLSCVCF